MGRRARELDAVLEGRTDVLRVDPRKIIVVPGWNPREVFNLEDLKATIPTRGVYVPIRVSKRDDTLILRDGERRLRACLELIAEGTNVVSIPAIIDSSKFSESDHLFNAIIANGGHQFLPIEEAEAFHRLLNLGSTVAEIAANIGKSVSYVNSMLELRKASLQLKEGLLNKTIGVTAAIKVIRTAENSGKSQEECIVDFQTVKKEKKEQRKREKDEGKNAENIFLPEPKISQKKLGSWDDELCGLIDDQTPEHVMRVIFDYIGLEKWRSVDRDILMTGKSGHE